jgi:1-deoxy-D-xylulose-5-phosphate reductoisomerase
MALPVQYALTYPLRSPGPQGFLDFAGVHTLTFSEPDPRRYPCLEMAYRASQASESHVIAMNAANEEAVSAFLKGHIPFGAIARLISRAIEETVPTRPEGLEHVLALHASARAHARKLLTAVGAPG